MGSLTETYAVMHAVLRGEKTTEEAAPVLGVDPRRLAIYQGFVRDHVTGILAQQFPRVKLAMDPVAWEQVARGFFEAHAPTDWEINEAAAPFPGHLAGELGRADGVALFHVSLAQFEWAQWCAYTDPALIPRPESLDRLVVNPTLQILELPCPVVGPVIALDRGESAPSPLPDAGDGAERVLIFRHPERETCAYWRVTEQLVVALSMAHEGTTLEAAAQAVGWAVSDVSAALDRAVEIGLCITPVHTQESAS